MARPSVLECQGVSCGHGGEVVLEGVDLVVGAGEVLTVLGGSGVGKSTLLRTMAGMLPPVGGVVKLFGVPLYGPDGLPRPDLTRRIGVVFQRDALFGSMTLLENLLLPVRELTRLPLRLAEQLARVKLALVRLEGLEARTPHEISGGQSKRAALARATMLDPALLFCDEPTAGLDPIVAGQVDRMLLRLRDVLGLAIVAVTHDVASVMTIADRALMLGAGTIRAQGTPAELEQDTRPEIAAFFRRALPQPP